MGSQGQALTGTVDNVGCRGYHSVTLAPKEVPVTVTVTGTFAFLGRISATLMNYYYSLRISS